MFRLIFIYLGGEVKCRVVPNWREVRREARRNKTARLIIQRSSARWARTR